MNKPETTRSAGRLMTVIGNSVSRLRNSIMQGELRPAKRDRENTFFHSSYAPLSSVVVERPGSPRPPWSLESDA